MKLLLCVDIEGISGIDDYRMLDSDSYEQTKALATADVNAVALGVREVFPEATFDVFDAHCGGGNLWEEDLAPGCRVLGGGWSSTFTRLVEQGRLAAYDGAMLIGQHAAAGIRDGFASHTNTLFAALRVNGKDAGETSELAWLLGHFGVPTVVVKEVGRHRGVARCIPVDEAHRRLREQARSAVLKIDEARPQTVETPVMIEIVYATARMAETAAQFPGFSRSGEHTVSFTAADFLAAWHAYNTSRTIGPVCAKLCFLDELSDLDGVEKKYREHVEEFVRGWLEGSLPFPPANH